ncbi:MAG: acylphosphatase [Chloroflexota bacterium]
MQEEGNVRLHAIISGHVQGVNFRFYTRQEADRLGVVGWVRNRWDGTVEVLAEGEKQFLVQFLGWLQHGPPAARVTDLKPTWSEATGEFSSFNVRMTTS